MKRLFLIFIQTIFVLTSSIAAYADQDVSDKSIQHINGLREAADSLHSIGRTDSAVIVGREAIRLAKESDNPTQIVGTNAAQGVFLRSLGNINGALECYDEALAIITSGKFRENPDQEAIEEIASLYINLAVLNLDMQNKDQAADNALLSAEWIAKSNDTELRSTIYGVAGSVLTGCGRLKEAKRLQGLAFDDALAAGDEEAAFRAAAYAMLVADRLGEKNDADAWRGKCKELLPKIGSIMAKLVYYQAECSICLKNNRQGEALYWFDEILKLDGIDNLPFVKYDCYNNMHMAYAAIGDYDNAYSALLKSNEFRDSLWQQEKTESLRDLTVKYQTKETELALAQSEAKRSRILMWLFAVLVLLLVGAVLFIIYASRQRRRRMEKELEFANLREETARQLVRQYVEGLESERERMSRELHDGVCNDLLAIQMNIKNEKSLDSTMKLINSCRESVRRISHELLPPEFAYADLDEVVRYYVGKQADANAGMVDITYESTSTDNSWEGIPDNYSLEIYRVIQEALGNALKHSGASKISVTLSLDKEMITALVVDNGRFNPKKSQGIGLDSMRRRAEAVNGYLEIRPGHSGGTSVKLSVSLTMF